MSVEKGVNAKCTPLGLSETPHLTAFGLSGSAVSTWPSALHVAGRCVARSSPWKSLVSLVGQGHRIRCGLALRRPHANRQLKLSMSHHRYHADGFGLTALSATKIPSS